MEKGWLERAFTEAFVDWRRKLQADEWYFVRVRDRLAETLSSEEAFNAIDEAVNVTLAQDHEFLWTEAMQLMLSLADKSSTTEMPPELSNRWTELMASAARFGTYQAARAEELRRWYRR
jgi:hypothetical protein